MISASWEAIGCELLRNSYYSDFSSSESASLFCLIYEGSLNDYIICYSHVISLLLGDSVYTAVWVGNSLFQIVKHPGLNFKDVGHEWLA